MSTTFNNSFCEFDFNLHNGRQMQELDAATIGPALKKLREARWPKLDDPDGRNQLAKLTGLRYQTIKETEDGRNLPNIEFIRKWVEACGATLPQFFAQFESVPTPDGDVRPVIGYKPLYDMLTVIIENSLKIGNKRRIDGITVNLEDISAAAIADAISTTEPSARLTTTLETSKLAPDEKEPGKTGTG